jgi:hypothetical protein
VALFGRVAGDAVELDRAHGLDRLQQRQLAQRQLRGGMPDIEQADRASLKDGVGQSLPRLADHRKVNGRQRAPSPFQAQRRPRERGQEDEGLGCLTFVVPAAEGLLRREALHPRQHLGEGLLNDG